MRIKYLFLVLGLAVLGACSSSRSATEGTVRNGVDVGYGPEDPNAINSAASSETITEEKYSANLSLADILKRQPGVRVRGQGSNTVVYVRSNTSSFDGGQEPLFVVDGSIVGFSYQAVANFEVNDIASVTVLRDASATSSYGMNGTNGVVLIKTKRKN